MRTKSRSSFDACIDDSLGDLERRKHIWKVCRSTVFF